MTQERSVLTLNKDLFTYCSVFDQVPFPTALFDQEGYVIYRNQKFEQYLDQVDGHAVSMDQSAPGFEQELIGFLEQNTLTHEWKAAGWNIIFRRVVSTEKEFVLATLKHRTSHLTNGNSESHLFSEDDRSWFRAIVNHAPEAILILDFQNKKYIEANPQAIKLFGIPKHELLHRHVGDLSPELLSDGRSAREISVGKIQKCIETGKTVKFNWEIKRPNGDLIPVIVRVLRLPTDKGILVRSSITDLSFNEQAKSEIKARKKQFNMLFGNDIFSMLICDLSGRIEDANPAFCKMIGMSRKELVGMPVRKLIHPEELSKHDECFSSQPKGNQKAHSVEMRIIHKTGKVLYCTCSSKLFTDPSGKQFQVQTIIDLTREKQIRKSLEDSEHKFRSLFSNSIIGILMIDVEQKSVLEANPMAQYILGRNLEEITSDPLLIFGNESTDDQNQKFIKTVLKKIRAGEQSVIKSQIVRPDGSLVWIRGGAYPLSSDDSNIIVIGFIDISDSERRKQQFIRQNNQLNAFIEHSVIPVAMFDSNMNYLFVGQKWVEMYPTQFGRDIVGKNYYDLHPNIPQRWKLAHMKALSGKTIKNDMDLHIKANGRKEWFRWLAKPWYEENQVIGGIIVYAEIITDEVLAADEARKQEARYKSFFENSTLGWIEAEAVKLIKYCQQMGAEEFSHDRAFELFTECQVVGFNDQIREIFRLSNTSVEEFKPMKYVTGSLSGFVRQMVNCLRNGIQVFEYELAITNEEEDKRNLFISVRLPEDDDYQHIVYGILDVTDLKSSISALRESEERYRTMFESNSLGVVYTNYRKSIIRVNGAFEQMFGYTEEEMQFKDEREMLYPKFRKQHDEIVRQLNSGETRFVSVEKEYKKKNGKKLIAHTTSNALYDDEGFHYGTVTIIRDISEHKLNELRLRKKNEELKKINQELDQFVYSAAHDLRAPIANVLGLVKLLKLETMSDEAHHYLKLQEKSLDKLDEFIKSIVDYSRNSRLDLAKNEIDWKEFIQDVLDQYMFSENASRLKVIVKVDQKIPFVSDLNRLSVVMNNLVSNAVRYMDISKDHPFLHITAKVTKTNVVLVVEDNGIGIEKQHLQSIFNLFYRANSDSKGTGIGLYIVKETISKLKGSIGVESEYRKGTKFIVQVKNFATSKRKKR
ncbi:MAG: PAS domain S-box protein [Bacteroidetes bacterium]|nr:PAS domain S-box protein [Bacteroidota bacterium]